MPAHWGKGSNNGNTFQGILGTCFELTLIPGDPKCHYGSLVRIWAYRSQMTDGILAQIYLRVDPVGSQILWLFPQFWNTYLE